MQRLFSEERLHVHAMLDAFLLKANIQKNLVEKKINRDHHNLSPSPFNATESWMSTKTNFTSFLTLEGSSSV
ncbi:MAG: hypothetical protein ABIQ21_21180 [Chryseolinea sp.]